MTIVFPDSLQLIETTQHVVLCAPFGEGEGVRLAVLVS